MTSFDLHPLPRCPFKDPLSKYSHILRSLGGGNQDFNPGIWRKTSVQPTRLHGELGFVQTHWSQHFLNSGLPSKNATLPSGDRSGGRRRIYLTLARGSRPCSCVFSSSALPSQECVLESAGDPGKDRDGGKSWGEGSSHSSWHRGVSLPVVIVPSRDFT